MQVYYIIYSVHTTGMNCNVLRRTVNPQTYKVLQILCTYPCLCSYSEELGAILDTGSDGRVRR